jgi:hypothetical protein
MAKQVLPTNFMDDILNESMNGKRRWTITQNDDGTYTLEDATTYDQLGNTFGQAQVNAMNKAINESVDQARVIDDYKTLAAVNQDGFVPGAKPVAQLISDLGGLVFAQDADGNWGYKAGGADTVIPFKNGQAIKVTVEGKGDIAGAWTVDLGVKVNAFAWFCPNITGLSNDCAGICWGNIKKFMTANIQGNSKNMNYVIDGTKITFPADSAHTFRNGAIVYFIVI